jgi:hypothetical protein
MISINWIHKSSCELDLSIYLEGENYGKDGRNQRQDLNRGHPEYEAVVLNIQPRRLEIKELADGVDDGRQGNGWLVYIHPNTDIHLFIVGLSSSRKQNRTG